MWKIPLSDIDLGDEEQEAVRLVLRSKWLAAGETTARFETEFARFIGVRHAIAVSSGTAALHLAMIASGVGEGDEIVMPSLGFVAVANVARHAKAIPVFADICSEADLTVDPEAVESAISDSTKVIVVMHYGGYACDMAAIGEIAEARGITVVEDAAHAPGGLLGNRKLGSFGDIGCFSFFPNKNLVTGEGGMLVTDDDDIAAEVRLLRSHGMTSVTWDRHQGHARSYDVLRPGLNYRLDEMRAAIGLVQLEKLERNNRRRVEIIASYRDLLCGLPGLSIPFEGHRGTTSGHLMPVLLHDGIDRARFMDAMREEGVQTSVHYPPIHLMTAHSLGSPAMNAGLEVTERVGAREVTLPLYPGLTDADLQAVADSVQRALANGSDRRED